jgi:hypothetical protein
MTRDEVITVLSANRGKRARVTFSDDVGWWCDITNVDDEGFVHSGPDGNEPASYWTRYDDVLLVEPATN